MNKAKLRELRVAVDQMNALKAAGRPADSLRYEIIPRLVMPEIDFFLSCAERGLAEQKPLL